MPPLDRLKGFEELFARVEQLATAKTEPDSKDTQFTVTVEEERHRQEIATMHEKNEDRRANRGMRSDYADKVFCYLVCYSIYCALLLLAAGFGKHTDFVLPDLVLTTVVGSTAVAAIGLVGFVVQGLFKPKD
jgi:hypothetical protein